MRTQLLQIFILFFLMDSFSLGAQKNIILNESLVANADQFKVKMGSQGFGKIWKFRFGDYSVISSKNGWTVSTNKSNLFNTKTERKSSEKFSFNLGIGPDIAKVNAARNISIETMNEIELFPHIYWGNDEVIQRSDNFLALINLNEDTTETWALLIKSELDASTGNKFESLLTNGTRKINISTVTSNKEGEINRSLPALGYQFDENGLYIGAVQYYGGGALGMNKNIVWINKEMDTKLKLVLAAAMTAILQIKVTSPGG